MVLFFSGNESLLKAYNVLNEFMFQSHMRFCCMPGCRQGFMVAWVCTAAPSPQKKKKPLCSPAKNRLSAILVICALEWLISKRALFIWSRIRKEPQLFKKLSTFSRITAGEGVAISRPRNNHPVAWISYPRLLTVFSKIWSIFVLFVQHGVSVAIPLLQGIQTDAALLLYSDHLQRCGSTCCLNVA